MSSTTTPDPAALDQYRRQARDWLSATMERRGDTSPDERSVTSGGDIDPDYLRGQRQLQRVLFEGGYAGITWPTEYGGQGLHQAFERAFHAEARHFVMPDLGVAGGAGMGVCAPTMLAHASPEFLGRTIPRILSGDAIVCQFFSDPEAGSDLAGVRTNAVRDGERWILNGSKIWSSGAYYADYGMCLARTDWDVPKHRGLTWFLVPTGAPGVTVERIRQINGSAEFCQEYFTDVELTDDDLIGPVNEGWGVTQTMLLYERGGGLHGGVRPATAGGPRVAPDLVALAAATGRRDAPGVADLIARAHVDDLARGALGRRLGAVMAANPSLAASFASYGKLASGVFDPIRADLAMQIGHGGAIAWDAPSSPGAGAAVGLLNSRFMAIAGGTCQMQRNTIGEKVLGLPREPSFDSRKPFREVLRDAQSWSGHVG